MSEREDISLSLPVVIGAIILIILVLWILSL